MSTIYSYLPDPRLDAEVREHPYPLMFATVSGAHLYGFASADSDWDLRGAHLLPLSAVAGLDAGEETVKLSHVRGGAEIDLVTHDARKFFALLLRNNGYVLEQLYSPLVVHTTPEHQELKEIARGCITRSCVRHYMGFAANQWRLFEKEEPRRVKPLLYVYRVLLTGIHLMRTGEVLASLPACNEEMRLPYVEELIARKTQGTEHGVLDDADLDFHRAEYLRLCRVLAEAAEASTLPAEPTARAALHDLLLRLRLPARALAA
ncbi:MAG: nucleotidyltransferase domain-containing protein [Gemmatimonadetes bacterium]|nr:nucleotidyltransferase domain-containing protein [Gemmatimonadota bacterium]